MSLTDYSDLEKEIKDAPPPRILKRGEEVKARIIKVDTGVSEKEGDYEGCTWHRLTFDVPADPTVIAFGDMMWELERDKLPAKGFQQGLYRFQTFANAFNLDYSRPFSWEDDLPGLEGWLIAGTRKSEEYGEQNTIQKYVVKK
jgi:hypothetical protein